MKQEYQDKIDSYLLARMSKEEIETFEKHIEQDKELKEQLYFTKNVRSAISSRKEISKQIEEWEKEYDSKKKSRSKIFNIFTTKSLYWMSSAAAIFIVVFFGYTNYFMNTELGYTDKSVIYETNGTISPRNIALRSDSNYDGIIEVLNNKEYSKAISMISGELNKLENEKYEVENSKDNIEDEEFLYKKEVFKLRFDELLWLKAIALKGLGQIEEAIEISDKLRNAPGIYKNQADSLYNSLLNK